MALGWAAELPISWEQAGEPFERWLLDLALRQIGLLVGTAPAAVVLHQDLHSENILLSGRGWLAIDPKPLVGDPAFDPAAILRDRRDELSQDPGAAGRIAANVRTMTSYLGLDRDRIQGWAVVHALAWAMTAHGFDRNLVDCACWLAMAE